MAEKAKEQKVTYIVLKYTGLRPLDTSSYLALGLSSIFLDNQESWQQQQLQNLADQQEEVFKQLYHVATYMFRSGASGHQFWS